MPQETRPTFRPATVTLVLLGVLVAYLSFLLLQPFLAPLFAGVVLGVLLCPLYQKMELHRKHPGIAAFLCVLLAAVILLGPVAFIITAALREAIELYHGWEHLNGPDGEGVWSKLYPAMEKVGGWIGMSPEELQQMAMDRYRDFGAYLLGKSGSMIKGAGGGIASFFIQFIVAMLTAYFGLMNGSGFRERISSMSPLGPKNTHALLDAGSEIIVASFYGVLAVGFAQGFLLAVGGWFAGLSAVVIWGAACAASSMLPLVGSALVWIPAGVFLMAQGHIGAGLSLLAWGGLVVANADNIVRPWVVGARMPVNALVVFISILGGVQVFGLMGLFAGPVIVGVALELVRIVGEEYPYTPGRIETNF